MRWPLIQPGLVILTNLQVGGINGLDEERVPLKNIVAEDVNLYCDCSALLTMKLLGFLLLISGWGIVLAAINMLHGTPVSIFILAGVAVEILGLVLVARTHLPVSEDRA